MVRWLLDTNVVSEIGKRRADRRVLGWIAGQPAGDMTVSIVTVAELRAGASAAATDVRRAELSEWIDRVITNAFADRIWPVSLAVLVEWLRLGSRLSAARKMRDPADLLVAATATVHDLIVVTRNIRDFAGTGLHVYDPWADTMHRMEAA